MDSTEIIITSIEEEKKNKDRVNVYINDNYGFSCSKDVVYMSSLKKGKKINLENIEGIIEEDNYIKCKNVALKVIERSAKTEKEIRDKLIAKQYNSETIQRVMEFLKVYGFAEDRKYIEMYIKEKSNSCGRNKIKFALVAKGIEQKLICEMIKEINPEDELSSAKALAEKKIKTINWQEDKRKGYKKLFDFLARKGYTVDVIKAVLSDILNENNLGGEIY